MKVDRFLLWQDGEYSYPLAMGFVPNLTSYIHDENTYNRPCMIVVPGGGYCIVTPTEGELVAKKFYEFGCNAFVLSYTTNLLTAEPLKEQPMKDLARAIRFVRSRAIEFHVRPNQLVICGFSAGGHLCGSVCVHHSDINDSKSEYAGISARPNAAILGYPVITSGEKAHTDSFRALLGDCPKTNELLYYSLEKQVSKDTPPCFLWQTATDELVPVENSALFAIALKEQNIPFAYHVFSMGPHGMSLANDDWANDRFGEPYTMEQTSRVMQALREGTIQAPEDIKQMLLGFESQDGTGFPPKQADAEVSAWPELAWAWLQKTIKVCDYEQYH